MSEGVTPSVTTGQGRFFIHIGALEAVVLAAVWAREPASVTVRDICECLREQRDIAYTTVMSVMGNLAKKHLLACDSSAMTYRYSAAIPGDKVAGEAINSVASRLYRSRLGAAVSHLLALNGQLTSTQLEALRQQAQEFLDGQ